MDPVNATLSTFGCAASGASWFLPKPVSTLSTPAAIQLPCNSSAKRNADNGETLRRLLSTTAATARRQHQGEFHAAIRRGKFQGMSLQRSPRWLAPGEPRDTASRACTALISESVWTSILGSPNRCHPQKFDLASGSGQLPQLWQITECWSALSIILRLTWDLLQWFGLLLRPRESLEAEISFYVVSWRCIGSAASSRGGSMRPPA